MLRSIIIIIFLIAPLFSGEKSSAVIQYLYPKPGASYIPPEGNLIVRFRTITPTQIGNLTSIFTINGSKSGQISGVTSIISDGKTIQFTPDRPFRLSEKITVRLMPCATGDRRMCYIDSSYTFQISSTPDPFVSIYDTEIKQQLPDPVVLRKSYKNMEALDPLIRNGLSIPSDFPWINITINNNPDTGFIFLNTLDDRGQPYNAIFDNNGAPIWYWQTPDQRQDFKVQKNGKLSMLIRRGFGGDGYGHIVLDSTYTVIDVLRAGGGYTTDEHELQILPDGHWFVIGIRGETVDMSQYVAGGKTNARVIVSAVQEFTPDHELLLCVSAWDLYDIRDTELESLTGGFFSFSHMNAIDIDEDGNILISSRHMSEVTKIHRETGEIIWRLGGTHSDFIFKNDELNGFRNQHDIRSLGDGHYTVFDNGNLHSPPVSRAVEYALDTTAMTATLVWQFRDTPDKHTRWLGNTQRLPNGNTLINWASLSLPKLIEVQPNGQKVFEMDFVNHTDCYRIFRFPWEGIAKVPYLVVEAHLDHISLLFNKFGDTEVDHYNIYDTQSNPSQLLATTDQPFIHLYELENGKIYKFGVTAVDIRGIESDYSNEEEVLIRFTRPGLNMIFNSNFSENSDSWIFVPFDSAVAEGSVSDGVFQFNINHGGTEIWDIQLYQQNLILIKGWEYVFEFDAWADAPRIIEAKVGKDSDPFKNYSKIGMTYITSEKMRYRFTFMMENQTDLDCRVVVNCGASDINVYLDNVYLAISDPAGTNSNPTRDPLSRDYELNGNYPNPFNNNTIIYFYLAKRSYIKLKLYDLNGRFIQNIVNRAMTAGKYEIVFEAHNLSSGIYFIQMEAEGRIHDTLKIIYLK